MSSSLEPILSVTVADGKYTVVQHRSGSVTAFRNGKDWDRDLTGDKLVLALAQEVDKLRSGIRALLNDAAKYPQLALHDHHTTRLEGLLP